MNDKFHIEIGFDCFEDEPSLVYGLKKILDGNEDLLELSVYSGLKNSKWVGGAYFKEAQQVSFRDLKKYIRGVNKAGFSFVLALNLVFREEIKLGEKEKEALNLLSENNEKYSLNNGVVIGKENLLDYVKTNNSNLKTISTSIAGLNGDSYLERLRKYDFVVPLNQHTNYANLKSYENYANKLMLFLSSMCESKNLEKCVAHYKAIEDRKPPRIKGLCQYERAMLINKPKDFKALLKMGVNNFKISRYTEYGLNYVSRFVDEIKNQTFK